MGVCKNKVIDIPISIPCFVDRAARVKLVQDLLKSLLHQRGQIPLQWSAISSDVESFRKSETESEEIMSPSFTAKVLTREEAKLAKEETRKKKARLKYLKSAEKFMNVSQANFDLIEQELMSSGDTDAVYFLFGATLLSPRESFMVELPQLPDPIFTSSSSSLGIHLFRAMVANEAFGDLISSRLAVSNIFVVFHKRIRPSSISSLSTMKILDSLHLPPSCIKVSFKLNINSSSNTNDAQDLSSKQDLQDAQLSPEKKLKSTTRRLRFDSGQTTTDFESCREPSFSTRSSSLNKSSVSSTSSTTNTSSSIRSSIDMELCTPATKKSHCAPTRYSLDSNSMHLCTPALGRNISKSPMELCTPAIPKGAALTPVPVKNLRGPGAFMELCTPAIPRCAMLTPAPVKNSCGPGAFMELCTPAIVRCSMEPCTPAIINPPIDPNLSSEDFMQLCTPAVNTNSRKLSLENASDISKISKSSKQLCSVDEYSTMELTPVTSNTCKRVSMIDLNSPISNCFDVDNDDNLEDVFICLPEPIRGFKL